MIDLFLFCYVTSVGKETLIDFFSSCFYKDLFFLFSLKNCSSESHEDIPFDDKV